MVLPEIAWEGSLGIYLACKGFKMIRTVNLDDRAPVAEPSLATV